MGGLEIAGRWFERRSLDDGVTWLWEPHVHPLLRCNIWHVRGRERDLLVDTGLGVAPLRDEISDLVDRPLIALATHIHYDHVGGLHEFETRLMHRAEAPRMSPYREFAPIVTADFPADILEQLSQGGYPIEDELLIDALPSADFDPAAFAITPTRPTRELDDGDVVDLGDRHLEVMHLPGHSPGSIGLWEPAAGILFSGDAIYDGPLIDELPDSDVAAYVRSMKRLRELPVRVVHGGHEPSFGRERLVELADAYLARREV
jgi:glyoxylase-like metal-dependent hydrolase (beta-lactamase superfamily II)